MECTHVPLPHFFSHCSNFPRPHCPYFHPAVCVFCSHRSWWWLSLPVMCTLCRLMWPEGWEANTAVGREWKPQMPSSLPSVWTLASELVYKIAVCWTVIHYKKYSCIVCIMPLFTILHVMRAGKLLSQICWLPVLFFMWLLHLLYRMGPTTQLNNLFDCVLNYLLVILFYLLRAGSFGYKLLNGR